MSTPDTPFAVASADTTTQTRIMNPRLRVIARAVWVAFAILAVGTFVAALPAFFNLLLTVSPEANLYSGQLFPEDVGALGQLGLSINFYAAFFVSSVAILAFVLSAVGVVIFWRKSDDWMAMFVSLMLVMFGVIPAGTLPALVAIQPAWYLPARVVMTLGAGSLPVVFYLFPDGRFIPRWTRALTIVWAAWTLLSSFVFSDLFASDLWFLVFLAWLGTGVFAQIYRYHRVSSPVQRQQTKWVVFGFTVFFLGGALSTLLSIIFSSLGQPGLPHLLFGLVNLAVFTVGTLLLVGLSIGLSILRYRLWDVDLVINRGLVYGGLTLALGIVFLGGLFLLQSLLGAVLGGQQTTTAAVVSTAVIVALFNPARRRVQNVVDHRFYHLRVDLHQLAEAQQPKALANPGALSGTKLGAYEVGQVLGRGGMGEVYKGHQTGLDRTVAIKILPPELATNAEFRARFEREAKTVANLRHPNVVHVFDFGSADNLYYMVMEFIDGQELGDYLREQGRIPLETARPIIRDIASALDYAHEQGLVHRDVKPSNVMLQKVTSTGTGTPHQRAILMDFGITKLVTGSTGLTQTGGTLGTLDYMAPEQIMSAREVDKRADVYALGIMVYQMLTGQLPFRNEGLGQLLFAHLQQPPPDARDLEPDLPGHIAKAITRALAKKPDERFQTAGEFAVALS